MLVLAATRASDGSISEVKSLDIVPDSQHNGRRSKLSPGLVLPIGKASRAPGNYALDVLTAGSGYWTLPQNR